MLKNLGIGLTLLSFVLSTSCEQKFTKEVDDSNHIEGSWKVTEIQYIYQDTTYVVNDKDEGRFIFTPHNYALLYNPTMKARPPFSNLSSPTDTETISAFRNIVFNTGIYTYKDSLLQTRADIAKVPGFEGGQQFYKVSYHTDTSIDLTMFDETYPNGDKPAWYKKLEVKFILKKETTPPRE